MCGFSSDKLSLPPNVCKWAEADEEKICERTVAWDFARLEAVGVDGLRTASKCARVSR
jgi:hypothetical protein